MRRKTILVVLIFFCAFFVSAQKVLYSPFIGTESQARFDVIGKAGDYYWVQKSKKQFRARKIRDAQSKGEDFNFEIYDERMNPVKTIPFTVSGDVIKEYFVPGDESLDQLLFLQCNQQITVLLNRVSPDGNVISNPDTLAWFPAKMKWS